MAPRTRLYKSSRLACVDAENWPRVVFLNVTDIGAAQATLEALPLGKAQLITFELYPIGPLKPLR